MYAFPHVCSERQFLGGQDFDPLQEISQVDGGRLRELGVLAVVEDVLEPHEKRVAFPLSPFSCRPPHPQKNIFIFNIGC